VIKYARICNGYGKIESPIDYGLWRFIHSGKWKGESLNIVSAFEVRKKFNNTITPEDFKGNQNACPGAGACRNVYSKYHVFSY
jgi:dihydroxy-acid dehydratase